MKKTSSCDEAFLATTNILDRIAKKAIVFSFFRKNEQTIQIGQTNGLDRFKCFGINDFPFASAYLTFYPVMI